MKFEDIRVIDWFDNIIKAFCRSNDDIYYCSLIAIDPITDLKIYTCISIRFFQNENQIRNIIETETIKENWDDFYTILNLVLPKNESFLIKTTDLKRDTSEIIKYKDNFNWSKGILFDDYPEVLDKAKDLDDWWLYWQV